MPEIKLQKRYKFAGDIFKILVEKCGFPVEAATSLLNEIPDAEVVEQTTLERIVERLDELDDLTLEQYNKSQAGTYEHDFADGKSVGLELAVDIVKEEGGLE